MDTNNMQGLITLMDRTKSISEHARDYIIPTDKLKAEYNETGVYLSAQGLGNFSISETCHNQISEKTQIPLKYYDRVKRANSKLLADNINEWIQTKEKRMLRTLDFSNVENPYKVCRAFLSDRYKPLDNYDLLLTTLNCFNKYKANTGNKIDIKMAHESETSFYLKVLMPDIKAEVCPGDTIMAGLLLSNSEVGKRALTVSPLVCRAYCMNDAISIETFRKHHLGQSLGITEIFTDITRRSQDETTWLELSDVLEATLSGYFLEEKAREYRELKGISFDSPNDKVKEITKTYKFSEYEAEQILENFMSEPDKSAYGVMNAVTGLGHKIEDNDRRIEVERLGDKIALNLLGVKEKDIEVLGEEV